MNTDKTADPAANSTAGNTITKIARSTGNLELMMLTASLDPRSALNIVTTLITDCAHVNRWRKITLTCKEFYDRAATRPTEPRLFDYWIAGSKGIYNTGVANSPVDRANASSLCAGALIDLIEAIHDRFDFDSYFDEDTLSIMLDVLLDHIESLPQSERGVATFNRFLNLSTRTVGHQKLPDRPFRDAVRRHFTYNLGATPKSKLWFLQELEKSGITIAGTYFGGDMASRLWTWICDGPHHYPTWAQILEPVMTMQHEMCGFSDELVNTQRQVFEACARATARICDFRKKYEAIRLKTLELAAGRPIHPPTVEADFDECKVTKIIIALNGNHADLCLDTLEQQMRTIAVLSSTIPGLISQIFTELDLELPKVTLLGNLKEPQQQQVEKPKEIGIDRQIL